MTEAGSRQSRTPANARLPLRSPARPTGLGSGASAVRETRAGPRSRICGGVKAFSGEGRQETDGGGDTTASARLSV